MDKAELIWMNGEFIAWDDAQVHVLTHGLHYGTGVFEGIRAYDTEQGTAVFRHREHLERLMGSAELFYLPMRWGVEEIRAATKELIRRNGLTACYIRPIAFRGYGEMGLYAKSAPVDLTIATWPWGAYLGEEGLARGIRATVSSWTRMSRSSLLPKGKICGQYVNSVLAKRDAVSAGYDEAILLDHDGFVAEASGENLFIVEKGRLLTPPRAAPILEGITRDSVMTLAKGFGLDVIEDFIPRERLFTADEVFMTGTAAEVTPVREIDGRQIGPGRRGPVTEQLQAAYMDAVRGKLEAYQRWLSPYEIHAAK